MLYSEMTSWRRLARGWPGQFRETLADQLLLRSMALHKALRDEDEVVSAEEAVGINRDLAAVKPGKFAPGLARALAIMYSPLKAAGRREEALATA